MVTKYDIDEEVFVKARVKAITIDSEGNVCYRLGDFNSFEESFGDFEEKDVYGRSDINVQKRR